MESFLKAKDETTFNRLPLLVLVSSFFRNPIRLPHIIMRAASNHSQCQSARESIVYPQHARHKLERAHSRRNNWIFCTHNALAIIYIRQNLSWHRSIIFLSHTNAFIQRSSIVVRPAKKGAHNEAGYACMTGRWMGAVCVRE
jgi:hypothetical protein